MNEEEFKKRLKERLQRELGDEIELRDGRRVRVKVEINKNLIYKVVVNENLESRIIQENQDEVNMPSKRIY